jgi:hypothetical protein
MVRLDEADPAQHLRGPLDGLGRADAAVQPQRLADLVADGVQRRERAHRLLEDDRDPSAADRAPLRAVGRHGREVDDFARQLWIGEQDRAGGDAGVGRQDAEDGLGQDGLARAALAHQGDGAVRRHVERHAGHRLHRPLVGGEDDPEVTDGQQGRRHRVPPKDAAAAASLTRG